MKIKILLIVLLILIPLNLNAAKNTKQIKVFDFFGNLENVIDLQNFNWLKIGDIKVTDFGSDGVPEILLSAPAGEKPYIQMYRLDGSKVDEWLIYPESYLGGVNFELADLDGDGVLEIITGATYGGGSHIIIYDNELKIKKSFFAFNAQDKGGVNIAIGNLYGDTKKEIIVSSNAHNQVRVFDQEGKILNSFELKNNFKNGQKITAFDLGQDGLAEIITYSNVGDESYLNFYQNNGLYLSSYLIFNKNFKGGINFDYQDHKLFIGAGFGGGPHLKIIDGYNNVISQFFTNESVFLGGVKFSVFENKIYTIPEQFSSATKPENEYILIDISEQSLKYYKNGFIIFSNPISSGTDYFPTPLGEYSIFHKSPLQYSKTYGLYMPFWMNFYTNYGIHELPYWPSGYREGENHLGTKASHGCVRLGIGAAEELYNLTNLGTKVYVQE